MEESPAITSWSLSDDSFLDGDGMHQSRVQIKVTFDPHATSTQEERETEPAATIAGSSSCATNASGEDMVSSRRAENSPPPSTAHMPLLASSSRVDDEVPPTYNIIEPREKKRLLKSAKKAGKFLGETPVIPDEDDRGVQITPEKPTFLKSVAKLGRSFSEAIFSEDDQATRGLMLTRDPVTKKGRSGKSVAGRSTASLTYHPAAYPVNFNGMGAFPSLGLGAFEIPVKPDLEKLIASSSSPPILKVNERRLHRNRSSSFSIFSTSSVNTTSTVNTFVSTRSSKASSTVETPVDTATAESRMRRVKAERLSRRLGEIVPSILLSATSGKESSPTDVDACTCGVMSRTWKRRRNLSLQSEKVLKVRTAVHSLKRSNSEKSLRSVIIEQPELLRERQRTMNVRRALKMTNLFGSKLPEGLLRVRNNPRNCILSEDLELSEEDWERLEYLWNNDRTTFYDLLGIEKQDLPPAHRRARSASYVSSIASSLIRNDDSDSMLLDDDFNTIPITVQHERGTTRISDSLRPGSKLRPLKFEAPPPTTPPPFSTYTRFSQHLSQPQTPITPDTTDDKSTPKDNQPRPSLSNERTVQTTVSIPRSTSKFRAKRERAAKLSKFFGVGYHDLFNSMLHGYTITVEKSPASGRSEHETNIRLDKGKVAKAKDATDKNGDMKEVIDRLRELKA